ncbi:MAG: protein-L-isoaspartate O-methyltransferase [Spirochaetes bacterium DG_61]|nr:MAG: protein-L-isoaspartate O-methyltransferase [Spirochaetes bacterium DG_61]
MLKTMCLQIILIFAFLTSFISPSLHADYSEEREKLVRRHIISEGIRDKAVIRSMRTVPREEFVPQRERKNAYANTPLPIGYGQTISQPYIVALMTELLQVDGDDIVLEIGTGSGYQAAVLAQIVHTVCTIEIIKPLLLQAERVFKRLGYTNVKTRYGDGYFGWEEHGPYDAIIVTAAADHIPPPLIRQLKPGGKMCIPVGQPYFTQVLKLIEKNENDEVRVRDIIPVIFVPLTRELVE